MQQYIESILSGYVNPQSLQALVVFTILLIWSFFWKIFGLWKSARNDERIWFIAILFLSSMGILEIAYLFFFAKEKFTQEKIRSNIKSYKIQIPFKNLKQ